MDFAYDDRTEQLRAQLQAFMDEHVFPAEKVFAAQLAEAEADGRIWQRPAVIDELKAQARRQGLWNLFLAHHPAGPACPTCSTRRWPRSPGTARRSPPRR